MMTYGILFHAICSVYTVTGVGQLVYSEGDPFHCYTENMWFPIQAV